MGDDVLDNEVSVGVAAKGLSALPVEVTAKAKSRFVSAADRLLGNVLDFSNAWLEAAPAKKRAKTAAEIEAIKAASQKITQENSIDAQFVQAAVNNAVAKAVHHQEKKILLLQEAMEGLKQRPLNAEEAASGANELDEGFLSRLEKRTEEASEDEIRAKWGKVLAGEIRRPGTFSAKIMRIIDEIDTETAELFQKICEHRIKNIIPICLAGRLEFMQKMKLEYAELIVPSDDNVVGEFNEGTYSDGQKFWCFGIDEFAIGLAQETEIKSLSSDVKPIQLGHKDDKRPQIPVYVLTDAGKALAATFGHKQKQAFRTYLIKLSEYLPEAEIQELARLNGFEKQGRLLQTWKNGKPVKAEAEKEMKAQD